MGEEHRAPAGMDRELDLSTLAHHLKDAGLNAQEVIFDAIPALVLEAAALSQAHAGIALEAEAPLSGLIALFATQAVPVASLEETLRQGIHLIGLPEQEGVTPSTPKGWADSGSALMAASESGVVRFHLFTGQPRERLEPSGVTVKEPSGHLDERAKWFTKRRDKRK